MHYVRARSQRLAGTAGGAAGGHELLTLQAQVADLKKQVRESYSREEAACNACLTYVNCWLPHTIIFTAWDLHLRTNPRSFPRASPPGWSSSFIGAPGSFPVLSGLILF